jgi:hypothetical protein
MGKDSTCLTDLRPAILANRLLAYLANCKKIALVHFRFQVIFIYLFAPFVSILLNVKYAFWRTRVFPIVNIVFINHLLAILVKPLPATKKNLGRRQRGSRYDCVSIHGSGGGGAYSNNIKSGSLLLSNVFWPRVRAPLLCMNSLCAPPPIAASPILPTILIIKYMKKTQWKIQAWEKSAQVSHFSYSSIIKLQAALWI